MERDAIDHMDARINAFGSALFFDEVTLEHGAANGVPDAIILYGAGRAGALGDVNAAAVTSAFGFFCPDLVEQLWPSVRAFGRPSSIATVLADGMAAAARVRWDPAAAAVVARHGATVVDSVVPLGTALFAGWQRMPRPDDPQGAAALVVMALRELRGDIHIQCVAGEGLHPLEAEIVTRGAAGAELHGWPAPYPDPDALRDRVAAAERATSARMHQHYGVLHDPELAALRDAVRALVLR
jgi:hypothetical protein